MFKFNKSNLTIKLKSLVPAGKNFTINLNFVMIITACFNLLLAINIFFGKINALSPSQPVSAQIVWDNPPNNQLLFKLY